MKKLTLTLAVLIAIIGSTMAQKYAYVDTDYILQNIPEYSDAQQELDDLSIKWQKEIENKLQEIDTKYKSYQADKVLLPKDMQIQKEEEIIAMEKQVKKMQKKRFGSNGDLFKKRQELIKPIQEKIFNAIEEIASTSNYAMIFDKATSNVVILWANPKYNISDDVLDKMGYSYTTK